MNRVQWKRVLLSLILGAGTVVAVVGSAIIVSRWPFADTTYIVIGLAITACVILASSVFYDGLRGLNK